MKKEEKLAEQYAILHGWEKVEGVKFELNGDEENYDCLYFSKEDLKDRLTDCIFWQYTEEMENVYEDVYDVVEYIEDHMEVPDFDAYKKSMKSTVSTGRQGK